MKSIAICALLTPVIAGGGLDIWPPDVPPASTIPSPSHPPPAVVARALLDRKIDYFTAYVCENLGAPDERVTHEELVEIAKLDFSPLNVLILVRKPNVPDRPPAMLGRRLFGNPDEEFLQSQPKRGLLTPSEVRAIALAMLDIGPQMSGPVLRNLMAQRKFASLGHYRSWFGDVTGEMVFRLP